MGRRQEQTVPQRRGPDGQQHRRRRSASLSTRECTSEPQRGPRAPARVAGIKKTRNNQRWSGCGESGASCAVAGNANRGRHRGDTTEVPPKNKHNYRATQKLRCWVLPEENENRNLRRSAAPVFITLCTIVQSMMWGVYTHTHTHTVEYYTVLMMNEIWSLETRLELEGVN